MVKGKKFQKLLIANRGEIAVRILRTCREMEIRTVALYSECDRTATHVQWADEAYPLGPSPATQSYLRIDRILDIAKEAGVDAIHPGYGFLSENPVFAYECEKSKIHFVGPAGSVVEKIGNKIKARQIAEKINLPIVPGLDRPLISVEEAEIIAEKLGYPVLLKAQAGGGGKGLQLVQSKSEMPASYHLAVTEAQESFNDPTLYLEKFLDPIHHIEVQIFGDCYGNVIAMGERECSIQRRHQKIIEESPSPFLSEETQQKIFQAAVLLGKEIGYQNAGTVEFLVDQNQNFFFLEMNPRLQVEHPITEQRIGLDLVRLQLGIASGHLLNDLLPSPLPTGNHAVECRIYAEDPDNNFMPSPGKIQRVRHPEGPFLRVDSAIYPGDEISIYYDPMIAKLITWGKTREEAVTRMKRTLREYQIVGPKTNIPFLLAVVSHPDFFKGSYDRSFLEKNQSQLKESLHHDHEEIAAIAALIFEEKQKTAKGINLNNHNGTQGMELWKMIARRESLR